MSFCGDNPDEDQWIYTHDRLKFNQERLSEVIYNLEGEYPNSQIRIQSSPNPDHDICFLYEKDFVANVRTTWRKILGNL